MELSERHIQQLESEGYDSVYEWRDEPNTVHEAHAHSHHTTLIVTEGSMTVTIDDTATVCTVGDRYELPPHTKHSVTVGSEGCHYIIGEK